MEEIWRIFMRYFGFMFRGRLRSYKNRATSRVRGATVGKLQAKASQGMRKVDNKIARAQDKALSPLDGKDKKKPK